MSGVRLRQANLAVSSVGDEQVLLDLTGSAYYSTRGSGAFLLQRLQAGTTEDELVLALVGLYDVDNVTAREDVRAFLLELDRLSLLEANDD